MKFLAFSIAIILSLSSCTTYQFTTLKSDLEKVEGTNNFYYQDSLVRFDFDFWGQNFPTSIIVENTGDNDLFLDLSRTLFLKNNVIVSDAVPKVQGVISGFVQDTGNIQAYTETSSSENTVYIPTGKKIELNYSIFSFPFSKEIRSKSTHVTERGYVEYTPYIFPQNSAPQYSIRFYFRNLETDKEGYAIECSFWPDMVITKSISPKKFEFRGPDAFFTNSK